jgi:hypothetical protein
MEQLKDSMIGLVLKIRLREGLMMIMMIDRSEVISLSIDVGCKPFNWYNLPSMLNYQAKHQTQVGLKFLREVLSKLVFLSSGILSVQKRHQGLKSKRWDFRRS